MGVAGAGRPLTLLNSLSLIICAMRPWITSMVVLQASLVALPSLSSVRFSCGSAPATMNPPRPVEERILYLVTIFIQQSCDRPYIFM